MENLTGKMVSFYYNRKLRVGNVEKQTDTLLTLKMVQDGNHAVFNTFKSFRFDKLESSIETLRLRDYPQYNDFSDKADFLNI